MRALDGAWARLSACKGCSLLVSACAVMLYAIANWVGFHVFGLDVYAGAGRVYAALALMSVATTAICELLFNLVDANRNSLRPDRLALMFAAGLLLTMVYGSQVFIKYYEGDDWLYMPFQYAKLDWAFLNMPISNHYVPLLNVILYVLSTLSDPTYYGNSVLFYLSSMLVLTGLARVVGAHTEKFGILTTATISFAIWPSFEGARTYFAGGFWLALPVATLLAMILVVRRIIEDPVAGLKGYLVLALLAVVTVLTSSQILIPLIYVLVYALPFWEAADGPGRKRLYRRGSVVATILLLPTAAAVVGRRDLIKTAPDLSGILDGAYFTNLALFVKAKVGFDKISTTILVCIILYAGIRYLSRRFHTREPGQFPELPVFLFVMVACGLTMPKMGFNEISTPIWICGLLLFGTRALLRRVRAGRPARSSEAVSNAAMTMCGLFMLLFFILQVGVGRRWGISTALADYYAMFPLAGFWLLASGLVAINTRAASAEGGSRAANSSRARSVYGLYWIKENRRFCVVSVALSMVFIFSLLKYTPTKKYIDQVVAQKGFVRDLGLAACSEAKAVGMDQRLLMRGKYPAARCKTCRDVLWVPEGVFEGAFFSLVAKQSAQRLCPDVSEKLVFRGAEATMESTGQSQESNHFYEKYYE